MAEASHAAAAATSGMTGVAGATVGEYVAGAATLFEQAVARAGAGPDRTSTLGTRTIRLRFAGSALAAKLLPALRHQPSHEGAADLTVLLWDAASTSTALPSAPWDAVAWHERGNTRAYNDERYSLSFDRPTDVFSVLDHQRQLAIYWTRDAALLPTFDTAAPMRRLLQGWLRHAQQYVVHAAAIGRPDAGMLLAGRGGSGKSTTAVLSLWYDDLQYAGDDFCLVQAEPEPRVFSLYNTAKLNRDALDRMPGLRPSVSNLERLDREKALLFLDTHFRGTLALSFPLRAIVLPRVSGARDTEVAPASPFEAYRAVGPDTAFRTLGDARGLLAMLKTLVHQLPCYHLALGTDRDGIHRAITGILDRA